MVQKTQHSKAEDAAQRGGDSNEPPDPNERLAHLQHERNQLNSRILHLTAQQDALSADINDLSANVKQVQTTVTNYGAALTDLQTRFHTLEYFHEQKSRMILGAIGDKKGPIDELIREFDQKINHMQERLRELGRKQSEAQEESNEAITVQTARQKDYDTANNYQQDVTSKLTDMEGLRKQITTADDNTDVASMYLLMHELDHELREPGIKSQHELSMELRQQLEKLEAAKENAREKSTALGKAQNEYNNHKTDLENQKLGRRQTLLAEVQAKFPVPPPSTPSGGTGTSGATGSTGASSSASSTSATSSPATAGAGTPSTATTQKK
jgi:chromosome segregation ATPase